MAKMFASYKEWGIQEYYLQLFPVLEGTQTLYKSKQHNEEVGKPYKALSSLAEHPSPPPPPFQQSTSLSSEKLF